MDKVRIIDLHNDVITAVSARRFSRYVKRAEKMGVEVMFVSVWTTKIKEPLKLIQYYRRVVDSVKTRVKLLLHIEDIWFVAEHNVQQFLQCAPFSVGLVWNFDNAIAGGACDSARLSPVGRKILDELVRHGVVVDLAHLNRESFWDVVGAVSGRQRLFCSHTCFGEVSHHVRNIDSEQIEAVVKSGGIVGLCFVGDFLVQGRRAVMEDIYRHILYFLQTFGDGNIAIGTDFWGTEHLPSGIYGYRSFRRLWKYLVRKGIDAGTLHKIFYSNARGFLVAREVRGDF